MYSPNLLIVLMIDNWEVVIFNPGLHYIEEAFNWLKTSLCWFLVYKTQPIVYICA